MQVDACARIMALGEGGQTLLSRFAFDNARQVLRGRDLAGVGALAWVNHGTYTLTGLDDPVELCEVGEVGLAPLKPPRDSEKGRRHTAEGEQVLGWRPACGERVPNTQWVLDEKLGEGGFGEVWVAHHQQLKGRRVFKFCFRADRVRTLKRELTLFRVLKERVGEHPNIVTVHDVYLEQAPYYLAIEYVPGRNLRAWWKDKQQTGALPDEATRLELVAQIADALQAAHNAGVLHRDVKPGNILVHETTGEHAPHSAQRVGEGLQTLGAQSQREDQHTDQHHGVPRLTAKLADFGIGQVVSGEVLGEMTKLGFTATLASPGSSFGGTQMYLAPELIAGKPATIRSDIYSLGVVLYQLVIADLDQPVTGDWMEKVPDPILADDLRQCLAGDPAARFANAAQLAERLRAIPDRRQVPIRRAAAVAARERAIFSNGALLLTALVLLFAVAMRLWQPTILRSMEWAAYDVRVRLRAIHNHPASANNLALVEINDESVVKVHDGSLGLHFSMLWPREVYGRLIQELAAQGAKAIALDVVFEGLRLDDPPVAMADGSFQESDHFFAHQMKRAGNVILAATEQTPPPALFFDSALAQGDVVTEPADILRRAKAFRYYRCWHSAFAQMEAEPDLGVSLDKAIVQRRSIVLPRSKELGDITIPLDADGDFDLADFGGRLPPGAPRKAKPFTEQRVWHMGVVLGAQQLKLDLLHAEVDLPHGRITLRGPNGVVRNIPVDAEGNFCIDWCMLPSDPNLTRAPMQELLTQNYNRLKGHISDLSNRWTGKLVVVGSTATHRNLSDFGATPLSEHTALVSEHWNVANQIIAGRFISRAPLGLELCVLALLTLSTAVLTWRLKPLVASGLVALLAGAYAAFTLLVFVHYGIWLSLVLPLLGSLMIHVCLLAWRAEFRLVGSRFFPGPV